jgi:rhodanese-related sulfurtransferase
MGFLERRITMNTSHPTLAQALLIDVADVLARQQAGEPMTLLDVRNARAWESSPLKIRGAIRLQPPEWHVDPALPKDRLTVVY